jgi:hypothetical protein
MDTASRLDIVFSASVIVGASVAGVLLHLLGA